MRTGIILLIIAFLISLTSCGVSRRDERQRRSLMMPKKSEIYVNKGRYKEINYSNRDKHKKKMQKKQKRDRRRHSALK
jgi:hypothetical protein